MNWFWRSDPSTYGLISYDIISLLFLVCVLLKHGRNRKMWFIKTDELDPRKLPFIVDRMQLIYSVLFVLHQITMRWKMLSIIAWLFFVCFVSVFGKW